jgi:hypothetical protein
VQIKSNQQLHGCLKLQTNKTFQQRQIYCRVPTCSLKTPAPLLTKFADVARLVDGQILRATKNREKLIILRDGPLRIMLPIKEEIYFDYRKA